VFLHWQKRHADAVSSRSWQFETQLLALPREKIMWNLQQNAGAIPGLRIASAGTAVREIQ
jgi:hypothetical protein